MTAKGRILHNTHKRLWTALNFKIIFEVSKVSRVRYDHAGYIKVTDDYQRYLEKYLPFEKFIIHWNNEKYEIIKSNATTMLPKHLVENRPSIIALMYFDSDIYALKKICWEAIKAWLEKASILGLGELNGIDPPRETLALMENFGLDYSRLKQFP